MFPEDPPDYMERGPFSYADQALIEHDLFATGFTDVECETVALSSRVSARDAAQGLVLGSPVAEALRPFDGKDATISAHVVTATRSGSSANVRPISRSVASETAVISRGA